MNKLIKYTVLLFMLGIITEVNAECSNKERLEISTAASNISMDYKLETLVIDFKGEFHPEIDPSQVELSETSEYRYYDKITLNANNISDKVYVVLRSDDGDINREFHYSDLDNGSLVYEVPDTLIIRHYTLTIYSELSNCLNEELRKIEVATPKYNDYFEEGICRNNNATYCNKYVTTDVSISSDEYNRLIDEYMQNENNNNSSNEQQSNEPTKEKNKFIYDIVIAICLCLVVVIIIVIVKRKKMKNIGV